MRQMVTATALLVVLLLAACGADEADSTDFSESGAQAQVTEVVKSYVGDRFGPEASKSVKTSFNKLEKGTNEGRMFVYGTAEYRYEHKTGKKYYYKFGFTFSLQHDGSQCNVREKKYYEVEREERK